MVCLCAMAKGLLWLRYNTILAKSKLCAFCCCYLLPDHVQAAFQGRSSLFAIRDLVRWHEALILDTAESEAVVYQWFSSHFRYTGFAHATRDSAPNIAGPVKRFSEHMPATMRPHLSEAKKASLSYGAKTSPLDDFFRSRWSGHGFALARCGVARHRQPSALCQWLRCHGHPREAEKATSQTLSGSSTTESCRRWCPITCTRNPSHEDGSRSSVATCRSSVDTVCYCLLDPFAFDPFASSSC